MGRAGWLSCTPVWHLCVIVHVFGYVSSTHIPVWTNGFWKLWVGPLPIPMHVMVHDTPVPWCVVHICMSVSNVAVSWEWGHSCSSASLGAMPLCIVLKCPHPLVVLCISVYRDLLAAPAEPRLGPAFPSLDPLNPSMEKGT